MELRSLITSTHKKITTYDDCKTYLQKTDEDPNNSNNFILFYSGVSIKKTSSLGMTPTSWNREHVWAQSLSLKWFETSGAGADLHHIRPTNGVVNSTRNNNKFGEVADGKTVYFAGDSTAAVAGKYGGGYFEPNDDVKGDVARIIFYLFTRYPQSDSHTWASIASSYELLKTWHMADPVSSMEISRNNEIFSIQGNRNPFIDYPDYATMIWG